MPTRVSRIGHIRRRLAEILTEYCGVYVDPHFLRQNYRDYWHGRSYGFSWSWFYYPLDRQHPLFDHGSAHAMADFIRLFESGLVINPYGSELFLCENDTK